jgi:hypothetical protein
MHELAGILLLVQPLNGERLEIGLLALLRHPDPDPAIPGDRLLLLGDLVVLGDTSKLRIELDEASSSAVMRCFENFSVSGKSHLQHLLS